MTSAITVYVKPSRVLVCKLGREHLANRGSSFSLRNHLPGLQSHLPPQKAGMLMGDCWELSP